MNEQNMTDLIYIHDAYKALNNALFGTEIVFGYQEGCMGALGRIYQVIDKNVPESMKSVSTQILANTSIKPETRAKMLLGEMPVKRD